MKVILHQQLQLDNKLLNDEDENKIRAFVNNVLTAKLGASWINCIGFEKIVESYNKNKVDFKRGVPEFSNINDILLSITIETLAWIIFKAQIYEKNIKIKKKPANKRPTATLTEDDVVLVCGGTKVCRRPTFIR